MAPHPWKPTPEQIRAAAGKTDAVPDVIALDLDVLFVGINPGLYTAAVGHHFARPGNRFWPALHRAGFTARQLSPFDERELLKSGYGITNIVRRATTAAGEVTREEYAEGARRLIAKIRRYRPRFVAIFGVEAYRRTFSRPDAVVGEQAERIGSARVWVLPNPSGLNAHYLLGDQVKLLREFREVVEASRTSAPSRARAPAEARRPRARERSRAKASQKSEDA